METSRASIIVRRLKATFVDFRKICPLQEEKTTVDLVVDESQSGVIQDSEIDTTQQPAAAL
jgi:hypothetical protein